MDWFALTASPLELIGRASAMYWALFLLFRFFLRRDIGAVGMGDFLFVVLVGDAAQNAMLGEHFGVADGFVVIGTLAAWNGLLDVLTYHVRWFERLATPGRLILFAKGQLLRRNMRREFITEEELRAKLHEHGLTSFAQVKVIYLEGNGELAFIKAG